MTGAAEGAGAADPLDAGRTGSGFTDAGGARVDAEALGSLGAGSALVAASALGAGSALGAASAGGELESLAAGAALGAGELLGFGAAGAFGAALAFEVAWEVAVDGSAGPGVDGAGALAGE